MEGVKKDGKVTFTVLSWPLKVPVYSVRSANPMVEPPLPLLHTFLMVDKKGHFCNVPKLTFTTTSCRDWPAVLR